MKALHVFPMFGNDRTAGSDYYQYMLTRELVGLGVDVEVQATWTGRVRPHAAFGLSWPRDYPPVACIADGIRVRRFPVSLSLPPLLGHALSRVVMRRWRREEDRYGSFPKGSEEAVVAFHERALARPVVYDYLTLLGRGPHALRLVAAAARAARHADVMLAGFMPFATLWYMTQIARRTGTPLVLLPLFHPEDLYHHFKLFYRCFERADALLVQTPYSAALFARLFPRANPIQVGVGVDPAEFADGRVDGGRFRARYGLGDARLVLCVGRKELYKRYDVAVEAVDRLADPRVVLVLIGADVDGKPVTSPYARYLGPLPRAELLDAYDACDVFVLPSEHESFGIVFLEAWMRRKPVIGSAHCQPVASLIADGEDGLLCRDAADLAARIAALLADPAMARRLGDAGYAKATAHYTWPRIAGRVLDLYRELAARGPRRAAGPPRSRDAHPCA